MNKKEARVSKRQAVREQRERKQRQQRITTIAIVAVIAVILAALLIAPSINRALTPVGEVIPVTPMPRPEGEGTALGNPDAPVRIEVFEDFQCPACKSYSEAVEPEVVANYVESGQVYYIYRHYPFLDDRSASRESDQSANASMCAAEQGRFWDYHDILFANWNGENQGAYADKRLVAFAESLGLDMNQFNACFEQNRYQDEIQADTSAAVQYGATGTPSIFVNGVQVTPGRVPAFEQMQEAIEAALAGG